MTNYLRHIARNLTYAAIDIGSNAVRLLVAEVIERDDHPVIKKQTLVRVPIRLGEDVFENGSIVRAKCDQLIKSLKAFRLLTEVYGVPYVRCCGTSAMREATNREEILTRVEMESGVHIEVIGGKDEADLIEHLLDPGPTEGPQLPLHRCGWWKYGTHLAGEGSTCEECEFQDRYGSDLEGEGGT